MLYTSAEEQVKTNQVTNIQYIRLAEVTSLDSSGRAKVRFFGEDAEAGKTYTYIDGYIPVVGDTVAMAVQGNTFIILGAVKKTAVIVKYALKGHEHEQYVLTETFDEHTHDQLTSGTRKVSLSGVEVIPATTETYSLGNEDKAFSKVYAMEYYADGARVYPYRVNSSSVSSRYVELNGTVFRPSANGVIDLGSSGYQYKSIYGQNIYANGSAISTSDKTKKKFIKSLPAKYTEFFRKLRPVVFKYKKGTSGRVHAGFIAQEVEQAMQECGIANEEFGGLVIQENGEYGLRYEEFIAIQTAIIQDMQKRIEELERRVQDDIRI